MDKRPTVPAWQVQAPAPVTAFVVVHTPPFRQGLEAQKAWVVAQVAPLKPGAHTHWKLFVLRLMTQLAPFWQRVRLAGHGMVLVVGATVGVVGMSQKRPVKPGAHKQRARLVVFWKQVPPFLQMPGKAQRLREGSVVPAGAAVVMAVGVWHRLPLKPAGQAQVARMVQVPPFWQGVVKQDWKGAILNWQTFPPNGDAQLQV